MLTDNQIKECLELIKKSNKHTAFEDACIEISQKYGLDIELVINEMYDYYME